MAATIDKKPEDVEFVCSYIADHSHGEGVIAAAKAEMAEIDAFLHEAENKRLYRMKLLMVLDHLGDQSYKRRRTTASPGVSEDVNSDTDEMSNFQEKIRSVIASHNGPLTVRQIIQSVDSYDKDALIIRAIKILGDQEVLARDDQGCIIAGTRFHV